MGDLGIKVKELFSSKGPLCNSEGFYNHQGECWNDALQMIFLYSDGIKEIVQKKLAESEIDPVEVDTLMRPYVNQEVKRVFTAVEKKGNTNNNNNINNNININNNNNNDNNNNNNNNNSIKNDYKKQISNLVELIKNKKQNEMAVQLGLLYIDLAYEYLTTLQKRFHRHYLAESMRISEKDAVCSTEERKGYVALEKLKEISLIFRSKGREGKLAGFFGKAIKEKNYIFKRDPTKIEKQYEAGGDPASRNNVINIFTRFFSLPIVKKEYENTFKFYGDRFIDKETKKNYTINESTVAIYCGVMIDKIGHAIAFYKCGGRSYLFDDNWGTIEFPWVEFFRLGLQTVGNREKELKKKWKKTYGIKYDDNYDNLVDLHYYFHGILTVENEKNQIIFKSKNYPFISKTLYEYADDKKKFPQEYTTYLWTGKEIKLSTLTSDYPFESVTPVKLENGETVTVTFRLEKQKSVFITKFSTFDFEGKMPTYSKSSEIFLGSRLREFNTTVEEILFHQHIEKVKKGKAKIDDIFYKDEYTPLKLGIEKGDLQMVKTAIEMGADIHKRVNEETPIFFAMTNDGEINLDIAEYLLKQGADKDLNSNTNLLRGLTPLQGCILYNDEEDMFENVKFLVEKGADVKIPSAKTNVLPIEYALFFNAPVEVSELLIKNGGGTPSCFTKQILKKRVGSDSLVMYWIRQRNIVKAALLAKCYRDAELEIWDDLNYENMTGDTAVKLALKLPEDNWSKKLLEVLLQNGANVNHIDRYGLTPMYFAIQLGKLQFLEELFDYGANPNIVMESLGTALQYAKRLGNPEIIKFMEEKFALPKYLKGSKYPPTRTTRKQSKKNTLTFVKRPTKRAINKAKASTTNSH